MTKRKVILCCAILVCGLMIWGVAGAAGVTTLDRWVFGAMGGPSEAGSVSLHATLGQAVVGAASSEHVQIAGGYEQPKIPAQVTVEVVIDITPGKPSNVIMLRSRARVAVAILSTRTFEAANVDPRTVRFAEAEPAGWVEEDVDGDNDVDLVLDFVAKELLLDEGDNEATLTGETYDGDLIVGTDRVKIRE